MIQVAKIIPPVSGSFTFGAQITLHMKTSLNLCAGDFPSYVILTLWVCDYMTSLCGTHCRHANYYIVRLHSVSMLTGMQFYLYEMCYVQFQLFFFSFSFLNDISSNLLGSSHQGAWIQRVSAKECMSMVQARCRNNNS